MGDGWVWRFGYGSNLSLANLVEKKNLRPVDFVTGRIRGWRLSFDLAAIPHVEPAFATVRPAQGEEVHGVAFRISAAEAAGLDRQEGGYTVEPVGVETYEGRVIGDVGLYVPRRAGTPGLLPSLRYLRLLRRGARDAGLQAEYVRRLDQQAHHVTPPAVRAQSREWIAEFEAQQQRHEAWTAERLARHDGSQPGLAPHTSALGYVVSVRAPFPSWRGHTITRRNLVHFNGRSVDSSDLRHGQPGFLPLPRMADCSVEEVEFLRQNLDHLLHRGGRIVARLQEFLDAQS